MRSSLLKTLILVLLTMVVLSVLLIPWFGILSGLSLLMGAIIYLLPTTLFAILFFKKENKNPKAILKGFYKGEIVKIITMVVLFGGVFYTGVLSPFPLFLGFLSAQFIYLWGILVRRKQHFLKEP